MPCRSPYRPLYVVRMSSAVCAISGVWLFDRNVPLFSKKLSRFGMSCRSDGTFGLSRKKWTLSKVIWTTCLTPFPSWHAFALSTFAALLTLVDDDAAACTGEAAACTGDAAVAAATPAVSDTAPMRVVIRLSAFAFFPGFMLTPPGATMNVRNTEPHVT